GGRRVRDHLRRPRLDRVEVGGTIRRGDRVRAHQTVVPRRRAEPRQHDLLLWARGRHAVDDDRGADLWQWKPAALQRGRARAEPLRWRWESAVHPTDGMAGDERGRARAPPPVPNGAPRG